MAEEKKKHDLVQLTGAQNEMLRRKLERNRKLKEAQKLIQRNEKKHEQQVNKAVSQSVVLTEEQQHVADTICKLDKPIQTLGGLAGTGKTTLVSNIMHRMKGFACCAFTGKAAEVLRSKGVDATTIHSLIYYPTDEKDSEGMPIFEKKPGLGVKGIIVDEASMVGNSIYNDLVSFGLPIIFVGDHGQLEPVGEGLNLMKDPDYKLETVHRNAGDIAMFAHHLRDGHSAETFRGSPLIKILSKDECVKYMKDVDQIICAKNETRVAINRYVRKMLGNEGDQPVKDDRVISLKNSKKLGIYNGTQGVVRSVGSLRMSIMFDNGRLVHTKYDTATFNQEKTPKDLFIHPIDFCYAITCHKAQGSEWKKVMVVEQVVYGWEHKRWAYTAASRAREELYWVLPS
jgi:exodeoxyribonuclease-5